MLWSLSLYRFATQNRTIVKSKKSKLNQKIRTVMVPDLAVIRCKDSVFKIHSIKNRENVKNPGIIA